jgi:ubiquilin
MLDYLIQSHPQLQAMGPGVRDVMQSEEFRRTLTDPNMLRQMMEMNRAMVQMGIPIPGMPASRPQPNFPAPGVTNTTPQPSRTGTSSPAPGQAQQPAAANPFEGLFPPTQPAQTSNANNPFMSLFGPPQGMTSPYGSSLPQQPNQPQQQPPPHPVLGVIPPPMNPQMPPAGSTPGYPGQPPVYAQGMQPPNWAEMYTMLNNLQNMVGQNPPGYTAGSSPPNSQAPYAPSHARPAADPLPIEERYQVPLCFVPY